MQEVLCSLDYTLITASQMPRCIFRSLYGDNVMLKRKDIDNRERINNALSISQTTCVNGIFVIFVFLSHFCQYVDTSSMPYFQPYLFLRSHLVQLIVAPFLFYSGYGIMEHIKTKGNRYVNDIPRIGECIATYFTQVVFSFAGIIVKI